jgi:hypothetical protein
MIIVHSMLASSAPRWDGSRVLFEVTASGQKVQCAISPMALEAVGHRRCTGTGELLRCFTRARRRIEGLALDKLHARPAGVFGRVSLWADDLGTLPPAGACGAAKLRA